MIKQLTPQFKSFAKLIEHFWQNDLGANCEVSALPLANGELHISAVDKSVGKTTSIALLPFAENDAELEQTPLGYLPKLQSQDPTVKALVKAIILAANHIGDDPRFSALKLVHNDAGAGHLMDAILAQRMEIGISAFGPYVFEKADEKVGHSCTLEFFDSINESRVRFVLLGPKAQQPDEGPLMQAQDEFDGVQVPVGPFLAEITVVPKGRQAESLIQLVLFLLARSVGRMKLEGLWKAPKVKTNKLTNLGNADGLTAASAANMWRHFFVPFEAERDLLRERKPRDSWGRIRTLMYGEIECLWVQPMDNGRSRYFRPMTCDNTLKPREKPALWKRLVDLGTKIPEGRLNELNATPERIEEGYPQLLLSDAEAVSGASDLVKKRLAWERENAEPGDVLLIMKSCTPLIIGEDLDSIKQEHLDLGGAPFLDLDIRLHGAFDVLAAQIRQLKDMVLAKQSVKEAGIIENGVAFVGYPDDGSTKEISEWLAAIGLKYTAHCLPTLGRESLMDTMRSKYVICHPGSAWRKITELVLAGEHTTILTPPLPYGFNGVKAFLQSVAKSSGRSLETLNPFLDEVHKELSVDVPASMGLAYITDFEEALRLVLGDGNFGVPMLAMLKELGFSQRLFLYQPPDGQQEAVVKQLKQAMVTALGDDTSVMIDFFEDVEQLRDLLQKAVSFQAVYSQISLDTRLYASQKAFFSFADLELGFWGAHRTAKRILGRCTWAGPSKYGSYVHVTGWNK